MNEPPPGYDLDWLNDRSAFQRNWVHGLRNASGLHLQYRLEGERPLEGATTPVVVGDWLASDDHVGFPGFVHGGLLSAVLDDVMGRAPAMLHRWVVTGRLDVRFRRGARAGSTLRVEGWMNRLRRRAISCSGRILAPDGAVVAEADGTYVTLPPSLQSEMVAAWPGFSEFLGEAAADAAGQ